MLVLSWCAFLLNGCTTVGFRGIKNAASVKKDELTLGKTRVLRALKTWYNNLTRGGGGKKDRKRFRPTDAWMQPKKRRAVPVVQDEIVHRVGIMAKSLKNKIKKAVVAEPKTKGAFDSHKEKVYQIHMSKPASGKKFQREVRVVARYAVGLVNSLRRDLQECLEHHERILPLLLDGGSFPDINVDDDENEPGGRGGNTSKRNQDEEGEGSEPPKKNKERNRPPRWGYQKVMGYREVRVFLAVAR
ncbi:hypothetical protein QBC44DRAFT_306870 [Cladorrhinum sp. PSN332]|nr:hypothetical protein QBC44DRAFT_306870 [Cladorrhinum sp. PSN332]